MQTILVIDDEYDIASSLEMVLTLEGYRVQVAYNGKEALEMLLKEQKPELVISDVMMPVMNAYEFLKVFRQTENLKKVPVILISAADLDKTRLQPGSWTVFIKKPFDLDRLIKQIRTLLAPDTTSACSDQNVR